MPILDELKKMYVKLGGKVDQDHSYENTSEILDAMGDIIQSTIELPGVTSDDNGKVLKVVDGSWDKGDEGGLPQVDTSDEGKVLAVNSSGEWDKGDAPLPSVTSADEGKVLTVDNSGAWGADDIPSELPSVTASDSGKVLAVNSSGEWDKVKNTYLITATENGSFVTCVGEDGDDNLNIDKIRQKAKAGIMPILRRKRSNGLIDGYYTYAGDNEFTNVKAENTQIVINRIIVNSGSVSPKEYIIPLS